MRTVEDVYLFDLRDFAEENGHLVPIEQMRDVPFEIKRVFYIYGASKNQIRGRHSHFLTQQVLVCLSGRCLVECTDGKDKKAFLLDKPSQALFIPELIWDEQTYLDSETIVLVLSNMKYDKRDYIVNYSAFLQAIKND